MSEYVFNISTGVSFRYERGENGSHQLYVHADWISPITNVLHGVGKMIFATIAENELEFYKLTKPIMEDEGLLRATIAEQMVSILNIEILENGGNELEIEKAKFEQRLGNTFNWVLYVDLKRDTQTGVE